MRKFLKGILFFTIPYFLLAYPLDLLISYNLKKSNYAWGEYNTWNDLYNGKINAEIVIYGSSRARVHIDPELLEKSFGLRAYNLGIDGHNFWLQYLRHKTLLKYNKKPKYIILSVDIWSLRNQEELFNSDQFLPYMLNNLDIKNFTASYKIFSSIDYHFPLMRYFGNKNAFVQSFENTIFFPQTKPERIKGFKAENRTWNADFSKAKAKMDTYEAKVDPKLIELFDNFLMECKQKDIKVILVYTPEYIEGQHFVKNRKYVINLFENYSEKHKIPFLDYSNNDICTKKKYFYNASHLNKIGAELFTNILINDLKERDIIITPK